MPTVWIDRLLRRLEADWCRPCKCSMEKLRRRLFALPELSVGCYRAHKEPDYYRENLHPVDRRSDIPAGMYACTATQYRCPQCGRRITVLDPFLPVRNEEKHEKPVVFEAGELDEFLWR